ncbi:MAG TPA: hypothetical protein ENK89_03655 [Desulfobulbaceae bacterium]|nr:hypothetical protein [Desulfobulbaceae bacterium]HHD62867.1 hypothetical protein [Desulfobulbaceae bacterium]
MKNRSILFFLLLVTGMLTTGSPLMAESELPLWDGAVNRLLAAGLYGIDTNDTPSMALRVETTGDMYKGLAADKARLNGQSITFSYEGSSGLLGFSAGYIYTSGADEGNLGSVYLGLDDPMGFNAYETGRSWYLALDISTSYQPHDDVVLGLSGKTMLMDDPYSFQDGRIFSFLLNMPVSYKKYITITPELQWSRTLPGQYQPRLDSGGVQNQGADTKDVIYGGVSISFSY